MSTFDIVPDAPGLLRIESLNVELKFNKTSPTTGRVSWNIPSPAAGCLAGTQAYCGMLVTLDTSPATQAKTPIDEQVYSSDPTASGNLFAGDTIGTSKVIGAFYNDRTTTYFDVTGLQDNTPYYISGYPVDCEYRYFGPGVHAYSTEYVNHGTDSTPGSQVVVLNSSGPKMGVKAGQFTGLSAGTAYKFKIQLGLIPKPQRPVDSTECTPTAPTYDITIFGDDAVTYSDLVQAINDQLAQLTPSVRGSTSPSTGMYVYSAATGLLTVWNGESYTQLPVVSAAQAPNALTQGQLWFNPITAALHEWTAMSTWTPKQYIASTKNPLIPSEHTLWVDGSTVREWNGLTWCVVQSFIQPVDPSLPTLPQEGSYWFNTALKQLFKWDSVLEMWTSTTASYTSAVDPTTPSEGVYWFNPSSLTLKRYVSTVWTDLTGFAVNVKAPSQVTIGFVWVNPTTNDVYQWNGTAWIQQTSITSTDPDLNPNSCATWFDTSGYVVYVWNTTTSAWVASHTMATPSDPSSAPILSPGTVWINTGASQTVPPTAHVWNGVCFVSHEYIMWPTDPRTLANGTLWYNPTVKTWYVLSGTTWTPTAVLTTASDPSTPASGSMWFNTTDNSLNMWNGAAWIPVAYSTTDVKPNKGLHWFDTTTHTLKMWDGKHWIAATPAATVELDCNGNLKFTDTKLGSLSLVTLFDGDLFKSLNVTSVIHDHVPGTDGASNIPTYNELGIGTDGTDNIRSSLANDLRYELGYPVVDVELTHEQIDYAITKAISEFRARSGLAYKRGFFFMQLNAETQRYYLTNKVAGLNTIAEVIGVYRMTSAFLSSAHGAGVYGQIVLQHLYNMGTFDLLSFHIMAEYTKLMEQLFAAKITFTWNEQTRELFMHHRFAKSERMVCIEATVERTEQDIMADRYAKPWIRKYAGGMCRLMLAEIRGKYSSLPGAGGNISLNANDLRVSGNEAIQSCIDDIESFVADRPEEYGMGSSMLFG